ncbi:CxxC motif protein [Haloarcula virus Hardyhisp2]|uniref:CxxC motif protein n=1 Tax=Haloarcula virus Hardyhisp2 TaxID=2811386 RepID=A0A898KB21_9VIRU|nr:CxxC motif protein [Haloarcula virus Hardyhisp2]QSJ05028.1 CxxC motif protein [Haloarcula virus Hardyhisp2]
MTLRESDATILKKYKFYNVGSLCADCQKSLHGDEVIRCIVEYFGRNEYIVEPFNLCESCVREIEE